MIHELRQKKKKSLANAILSRETPKSICNSNLSHFPTEVLRLALQDVQMAKNENSSLKARERSGGNGL